MGAFAPGSAQGGPAGGQLGGQQPGGGGSYLGGMTLIPSVSLAMQPGAGGSYAIQAATLAQQQQMQLAMVAQQRALAAQQAAVKQQKAAAAAVRTPPVPGVGNPAQGPAGGQRAERDLKAVVWQRREEAASVLLWRRATAADHDAACEEEEDEALERYVRNASLLAELMQPGAEAGHLLQADGGLDSAHAAMEALKAETAAAERGAEREAAARAAAADAKRARRAAEAALGEELAAAASSEAVAAAAARFRRHTGVDLARGVPLSGEPPAAAAFWAGIRRSVAPPEEVAALHAEPRRRVTQL